MAIKEKGLAREVVGVSRHAKSLRLAQQSGAIDRGSQQLAIIAGADLVVFATPVNAIMSKACEAARFLDDAALVIDVGSSKEMIVARLERIFPRFVGCHPLAGSEKRGIAYADKDLFRDSLCIVTPTKKTNQQDVAKVQAFWRAVGAKVKNVSPVEHDTTVAFISHLPHALAFSLLGSVPAKCLPFVATSFKDTTRIVASDIELWADIFLSNRKNVTGAIELFQKQLAQLKKAIGANDRRLLESILRKAQAKRESLK